MQPDINEKFITVPLLAGIQNLAHGFTTKAAGDMLNEQDVEKLRLQLDAGRLYFLKQVHGAAVAAPENRPGRPRADAWAGKPLSGIFPCVVTADCLPVLFCCPVSKVVGAAHAGWRGLAAGILKNTLKTMNVEAEKVCVALGPCIGPCCYTVGGDVLRAFGLDSKSKGKSTENNATLDLAGLARQQLTEAGVLPHKIQSVSLCTSCNGSLFFSHRRKKSPERMAAFIGWR